MECWCGEQVVIQTVADMSNPNCGKNFGVVRTTKIHLTKGVDSLSYWMRMLLLKGM